MLNHWLLIALIHLKPGGLKAGLHGGRRSQARTVAMSHLRNYWVIRLSKFQSCVLSQNHDFTTDVEFFKNNRCHWIGLHYQGPYIIRSRRLFLEDTGGLPHLQCVPYLQTGYKFSANSKPLTPSRLPHGSKHMPCTPQAHWANRLFMGLGREVFIRVFSHSLCDSTHCDNEQVKWIIIHPTWKVKSCSYF